MDEATARSTEWPKHLRYDARTGIITCSVDFTAAPVSNVQVRTFTEAQLDLNQKVRDLFSVLDFGEGNDGINEAIKALGLSLKVFDRLDLERVTPEVRNG